MPIIINDFPTGQRLPDYFPVYVYNQQVTNSPAPDAIEKNLPTSNNYYHNPGCYIACYKHADGIYSVEKNIFVVGQIRIKGLYNKKTHLCEPFQQHGYDFSHSEVHNKLCNQVFKSCQKNQCWAGGDTMGWYSS